MSFWSCRSLLHSCPDSRYLLSECQLLSVPRDTIESVPIYRFRIYDGSQILRSMGVVIHQRSERSMADYAFNRRFISIHCMIFEKGSL